MRNPFSDQPVTLAIAYDKKTLKSVEETKIHSCTDVINAQRNNFLSNQASNNSRRIY
ncbi:hypothetical protein IQ225_09025 [Synechocystis salina LEGE 06155]|nr:hypothetical protein [Synechocystis salina LEGE 06155]